MLELNFNLPWTSFGRLRSLHTNAVIFAFGGCALFATSYCTVRRTCQAQLFAPKLAAFTFWGWQLVIVLAAVSLPLGFTSSKEYAELEWPIDLLITIMWVAYALVFFGVLMKRTTKHIYVGNWFFGAFIITVALLQLRQAGSTAQTWRSCSRPSATAATARCRHESSIWGMTKCMCSPPMYSVLRNMSPRAS